MTMKPFDEDDPYELIGVGLSDGNLDEMAECIVDEYIRLGWTDEQLLRLFTRPFFVMTHRIYRQKGEDWVRVLVQRVREKWTPTAA